MKQEEKILLYWSGEADPKLISEVKQLLQSDSSAREYYDELLGLHEQLNDINVPDRRPGLLDEVLEERGAADFPERTEKKQTSSQGTGWIRWKGWAIAASVTFLAILILTWSPQDDKPTSVAAPSPENQIEKPEHRHISATKKKTSLSQRMLSKSSLFRESGKGLANSRKERHRWGRKRLRKQNT